MKLPKRSKLLFGHGHSGPRFSAADIPFLVSTRATWAKLISVLHDMQHEQQDELQRIAAEQLVRKLELERREMKSILQMLERVPRAWLP